MGINAIVVVENSTRIALANFVQGMREDQWGRYLMPTQESGFGDAWEEFIHDSKSYFSLVYPPRFRWLGLYGFSRNGKSEQDSDIPRANPDGPDPENPYNLTFLTAMLVVEHLAGGPIRVGNDAVGYRTPESVGSARDEFCLPPNLDDILPQWREVKHYSIDKPGLVF